MIVKQAAEAPYIGLAVGSWPSAVYVNNVEYRLVFDGFESAVYMAVSGQVLEVR